ncbi:MAG: cell division protein ZapB [Nitrospiraceae bacterium]|nr:cell division protein ZapB [Nitrospiraceae bacterium]
MPEEQKEQKEQNLFGPGNGQKQKGPQNGEEAKELETLKNLEMQISGAIDKIRLLKDTKSSLERRVSELESIIDKKNEELLRVTSEKNNIKDQIEGLLNELQNIEP